MSRLLARSAPAAPRYRRKNGRIGVYCGSERALQGLLRGRGPYMSRIVPRIREPEGGFPPASVSGFGERFDGCSGIQVVVCSSIGHPDRGFESLKVARLLPR